ncbi:MAG: hypothetical protein A2798_02220 [Candidatus Levybacteria bacterium RIFCSPHIGHO2_01_FULL_37_17]|nr:MAG: hypothetical protein A2798_02220 [Candidatus Levybacteria bacterium RIFCSPHIGHO2_01_FULL_37_17]OGH36694.1 MAG: hypothetical protein A2959_00210 [Candidatus Levybacteria bacterium RIFCSPLOWO2_01_FULL_38_23]
MKKMINFAVIIPSYNEHKSLNVLLKKIRIKYNNPVYVIDDSLSPQKEQIKALQKKFSKVYVTSRNFKKGRGSAVLVGFKKAVKNLNNDYLLEMDSDLAHDPYEIQRFLSKADEGSYDLIIGSRYFPGGKIKNIEKERTILSRLINYFLKIWLGINVTDFTSGFRLYSRKAIEIVLSNKIQSKGFITLSETLYIIHRNKLSIGEVPITWNYRRFGKSNVNSRELLISLYFVLKMKLF